MLSLNTDEAKTRLYELLTKIETVQEPIVICRNDRPLAKLISVPKSANPLKQDPELKQVFFYADPTLPLDESEWPDESR